MCYRQAPARRGSYCEARLEREGQGPLVVECTRGPAVESRHLVDAAVVDPAGRLVQGWGETEAVVYPRSAIKSVQVLPLLESGAAERYAVSDEEIALACSSHNGQPAHVAVVRGWLARAGLGEEDLECGPHLPYHTPSAHACVRLGESGGGGPQHVLGQAQRLPGDGAGAG